MDHAVEIDGQQVRQHFSQQLRQAVEMIVAVVQVVDQPDVLQVQMIDDRQLVLRLSEPAAVVVQADLAAEPRGRFGDRPDAVRLGCRCAVCCSASVGVGPPPPVTQSWVLQAVLAQQVENPPAVVVQGRETRRP